jgi:hypothetical protein
VEVKIKGTFFLLILIIIIGFLVGCDMDMSSEAFIQLVPIAGATTALGEFTISFEIRAPLPDSATNFTYSFNFYNQYNGTGNVLPKTIDYGLSTMPLAVSAGDAASAIIAGTTSTTYPRSVRIEVGHTNFTTGERHIPAIVIMNINLQ